CTDFTSLYPMSMISVNASPETKVGEDYEDETFDVEMTDGSVVRFRKEPEGLTKSIVTELLEERDKKKSARDDHEMGCEEYIKYDNQQNAIKVVMNCFDSETEVVGEDGVKPVEDVEVGERLYTIDPEKREVETKRVVETHEYPYDGEMVDIKTRYTDFSVTPNHRMLVETGSGEAEFVEAGDLNDYTNYKIPRGEPIEGRKPEKFSLLEEGDAETAYLYTDGHGASYKRKVGEPSDALEYESNRKAYKCEPAHVAENPEVAAEADEVLIQRGAKHSSVPAEYEMEDWLRLVGWYVAEGSVYEIQPKEYENATRGRSKKVQLGQLDEGGRERIVGLLERMGLNPRREARQISFCNAVIADWLVENCGSRSANKKLPDFVFELDASLLEHLFDALMRGDGDRHSGVRYSTKSDRLKDDMVRLAVHLGYKPLVNRDSGVWRIRFSDNEGAFRMHRNGETSESDGNVYCVTMEDNHTVLAGRNGLFQWTGNSYYGVAGYPRFRLYDREMGSAVTATGRKVIEHTKEVVENEGYEVVYGDTDSTLVELGDGDLETLVERGESIERTVNESYDDFAVEEFNAHEHRWEIEFEKLYRRFFQAGRKKRYAGSLVWKEGKEVDDLDITGFEYKRSDVSQVTKEVQKEVIRRILDGEGFDEISEYLQGVVARFKNGEYGYDDVGIPGGIGQKLESYDTETAQVKGAKYANEQFGTNFTSGSKPKRLYVKRVKGDYPTTDVVCFEYPEQIPDEFEIDWDKMLEKTVQGPIERILEALDWSWSEVVTGQRQQGLGSFT
ncbi:MAG: DNA polymerase domain-containing protein, partial [Halobacteriales archaeon]|nr:DNA polymerase domain-containing protein [Halobacteriales archaeon]